MIALDQTPDQAIVHYLGSGSKRVGVVHGDCSALGTLKIVNLFPDFFHAVLSEMLQC
jgi:hypothetical protein